MLKAKKFATTLAIGLALVTAVSGCGKKSEVAEVVEPPAVTEPQSPVTLPENLNSGQVMITGTAKVGHDLTATPFGFNPVPASYNYTWYRGLDVIGHGQTYHEVNADAGKTLTVQVEANYTGTEGAPGAIASASIDVSPEIPVPPTIKPMPMPTVDPVMPTSPKPITPGVDPVLPANPGTNTPSVTPTLPANPTPLPIPEVPKPEVPANPTPVAPPVVVPSPNPPAADTKPAVPEEPVVTPKPTPIPEEVPPADIPPIDEELVSPPVAQLPPAPPTATVPPVNPSVPSPDFDLPVGTLPCTLNPGAVADTKPGLAVGATVLGRSGKLTRDALTTETPCSAGETIDPSAPVGALPVTPKDEAMPLTQTPSNKLMPAPKLSPQFKAGKVAVTQDGSMLTATVSGFTPEPTSLDYQWFANDELIPGATAATFETGNAESLSDTAYTVRVTAHKTGYTDRIIAGYFNHVPPTGLIRR